MFRAPRALVICQLLYLALPLDKASSQIKAMCVQSAVLVEKLQGRSRWPRFEADMMTWNTFSK